MHVLKRTGYSSGQKCINLCLCNRLDSEGYSLGKHARHAEKVCEGGKQ